MDGTCNNCGTPCNDPKHECCGGCTTIPYRTTTTAGPPPPPPFSIIPLPVPLPTAQPPPPPPPPPPPSCFPSESKVNLENGKSVTMSELNIGDRVQTGICAYLYIFY